MDIPARVWHCVASPQKIRKDEFDMSTQTRFTPTEVCILIAHETVSMLDTVQTRSPNA